MRKFLHNFPLHSFLFIYFISFFLYAQNPELVDVSMVKRTLVYGSVFSIFLFFSCYLFFRDKIKSGITSTLILLILFNYGVMYDGLEVLYYNDQWPFANIHRYLLIVTLLLCVAVIYFVHRKIAKGSVINYFLNWLVLLLLFFNLGRIRFSSGGGDPITSPLVTQHSDGEKNKVHPNIYYVILDGYANQSVLKKQYQFDNSAFLDFLQWKGFYVADSAHANYFSTMSSLAATFNLDYLPSPSGDQRRQLLRNNRLFSLLKKEGYRLYNLESGYSVTSRFTQIDSTIAISSPNEFERSILKFTIFRLDEVFGITQHRRLKSQIDKLSTIAGIPPGPKFVFTHLVAPHPPFVFNKLGQHVFNMKNHDNSWEPKENYLGQLQYINSVIEQFVSRILESDPGAVMVIQSDHGPWVEHADKTQRFESRAMILNAIRLPGAGKEKLYRHISSVNTFRLIMQNYFDPSYSLLPDSLAGKDEIVGSIFFLKKK